MSKENNIPKHWQVKKLGEVCKAKEGLRRGPFGSAIKKEFFVPEGYKVYQQSNAIYNDAKKGKYFIDEKKYQELINFKVDPGDLIVSCSGTLGRISEIPIDAKPGIINQALLRIRLLDHLISKKFFLYYFRSAFFQKRIFEQSQGTAMNNLIGIKDFKEIELLIPPLSEQQAIVSKIEELLSDLENGKQQLQTAKQQLKVYRQSLLKAAFEGRLTHLNYDSSDLCDEHDLERKLKNNQGNHNNHKNHSADNLPEGWKQTNLGKIISISSGNGLTRSKRDDEGKYLVYGGNGVTGKHSKFLFEEEKLIIGRVGVHCGNTYITKPKSWVTDNAFVVSFSEKEVGMSFLLQFIKYLNLNKYSSSTAQPVISQGKLYPIEISLPPLKEQQLIVDELESKLTVCDKIEETISQSLLQAESLKQSILKMAFEGRLV